MPALKNKGKGKQAESSSSLPSRKEAEEIVARALAGTETDDEVPSDMIPSDDADMLRAVSRAEQQRPVASSADQGEGSRAAGTLSLSRPKPGASSESAEPAPVGLGEVADAIDKIQADPGSEHGSVQDDVPPSEALSVSGNVSLLMSKMDVLFDKITGLEGSVGKVTEKLNSVEESANRANTLANHVSNDLDRIANLQKSLASIQNSNSAGSDSITEGIKRGLDPEINATRVGLKDAPTAPTPSGVPLRKKPRRDF